MPIRAEDLKTKSTRPHVVFAGLALGVMILTGLMSVINPAVFQPYFGPVSPLLGVLFASGLGFALLKLLVFRTEFAIYTGNRRGVWLAACFAVLFIPPIILVDSTIVFPANMNVAFPQSLLFYPVIGYVVEVVFHLLPLTLLVFVLVTVFKRAGYEHIALASILLVSVLEPIYQALSLDMVVYPAWAVTYVGGHVLLINLAQLLLFKRYDFVSMYSFRLVYYLLWHIVWGYLRLKLLF